MNYIKTMECGLCPYEGCPVIDGIVDVICPYGGYVLDGEEDEDPD